MPHQFDRLDVSMFVSVSVCTMKLTTRCIAKVGARETTSHDYNDNSLVGEDLLQCRSYTYDTRRHIYVNDICRRQRQSTRFVVAVACIHCIERNNDQSDAVIDQTLLLSLKLLSRNSP